MNCIFSAQKTVSSCLCGPGRMLTWCPEYTYRCMQGARRRHSLLTTSLSSYWRGLLSLGACVRLLAVPHGASSILPDSRKLIFGQMMFLPGRNTRKHLNMPLQDSVDLRAACFCHRQIVDIGYVCSVCLSSMCISQTLAFTLMSSCSLLLGDSEVHYLRYKVLRCDC